jgi:hypothetical protein
MIFPADVILFLLALIEPATQEGQAYCTLAGLAIYFAGIVVVAAPVAMIVERIALGVKRA